MAKFIQDGDIRSCVRALCKLEVVLKVYHILPQSIKG